MIFVDVIVVMALTGQVRNTPFHAVKGVTVNRAMPSSPSELATAQRVLGSGCRRSYASIRRTVLVSTVQGVSTAGPAIVCAATGRVRQRRRCQGIGQIGRAHV